MLKKILFAFFLLTLSTASSGQIYLIKGDSLHCFTRGQAVGIATSLTELNECRELSLLSEQGLEQWSLLVDAKDGEIINLEQQVRLHFEIGEYYKNQLATTQTAYKKEVRRHKFTKVMGVLLITLAAGIVVMQ